MTADGIGSFTGLQEPGQTFYFSRFFCPVVPAGLAISTAWMPAFPALRREVGEQLVLGSHGYFIWRLTVLMMAAAIFAVLMEWVVNEITRRAETKLLAQQEVVADAPKSLPLSDAELCALMMNLLDNAIHAVSQTEKPFLRLDMHQKDGFFVFVCENASMPEPAGFPGSAALCK